MSYFQHTIKETITIAGIGLHTGEKVKIKIHPAPSNSGIRFLRSDVRSDYAIPARVEYVVDTRYCTTIGLNGSNISTIEHLMAAFAGMGVDNALVEINGQEVPSLDGSAYPFAAMIKKAGLIGQDEPRRFIEIAESVSLGTEDKGIRMSPSRHLKVNLDIKFDHPLIQKQQYSGKIDANTFFNKISRARTFGFLKEVEWLKENGLARGGSLENALVLDEASVLNRDGLRFPDEFVRHKVLDLLGDLYLLGGHVLGEINAHKSGHELHLQLARKLLAMPQAWRYKEFSLKARQPSWSFERGREEAFVFVGSSA